MKDVKSSFFQHHETSWSRKRSLKYSAIFIVYFTCLNSEDARLRVALLCLDLSDEVFFEEGFDFSDSDLDDAEPELEDCDAESLWK